MITRTPMKTLMLLGLLSIASNASAQQRDYYVGIGFGGTNFKSKSFNVDIPTLPSVASVVDDSDSNFRFYGGYRFNPNFAVEAV